MSRKPPVKFNPCRKCRVVPVPSSVLRMLVKAKPPRVMFYVECDCEDRILYLTPEDAEREWNEINPPNDAN